MPQLNAALNSYKINMLTTKVYRNIIIITLKINVHNNLFIVASYTKYKIDRNRK